MKTLIDANAFCKPATHSPPEPSFEAAREAKTLLHASGFSDVSKVVPSQSGWNGMQCFAVQLGTQMAHLKVSPANKLLHPQGVAREFHNAIKAADKKIAPPVLWADEAKQALMTVRIVDQSKEAQATRFWGPVTKATLRALASLHDSERKPSIPFDEIATRAKFEHLFDEARAKSGPLALADVRQLTFSLIEKLKQFPVQQTACHGDMNGCNHLYTPERVYLIDWADAKIDDPISDLVNLACHLGCDITQMANVWRAYSGRRGTSAAEFEQLCLQFALSNCKRYAMRVTGMPWHNPQTRDSDLAKATSLIQNDARALHLPVPQEVSSAKVA